MSMQIGSNALVAVRVPVTKSGNPVTTTTQVEVTATQLVNAGGFIQQPAIADVGAAPTQAQFNALLAALRLAGVLSAT